MSIPFFGKKSSLIGVVQAKQINAARSFSWEAVGRWCIYLLFGLLPIWFLPFTAFPVEDGKGLLVALLVFLALGAWLGQGLGSGTLSFPRSKLWLIVILFLAISGISVLFSESRAVGMWGNNNQPDTFMNFLLAIGILFVVPLFLKNIEHITKALFFFAGSLGLAGLFSLFQFFGAFLLPFDFARAATFNTVGAVQSLGVFLAAGFAVFIAMIGSLQLPRVLFALFLAASLILGVALMLINSPFVWFGLLVAFAILASWQIMHMYGSRKGTAEGGSGGAHIDIAPKATLPMILIVLASILFFVNPPISNIVRLPATVTLGFPASMNIAREVFGSSWKDTLVGSGPASYLYEYLKHRPIAINDTPFFNVRFIQAYSFAATVLVTLGVLGFSLLLLMLGYFIKISFSGISLLNRSSSPLGKTAIAAFAGFVFLVISWFFFPLNATLLFCTFLLGGLVLASLRVGKGIEEKSFSFVQSPQQVFIFSFAMVIVLTVLMVGGYWSAQRYVAASMHAWGVRTFNNSQDIDEAISRVSLAVSLDGSTERYLQTLSQLFVLNGNKVLRDTSLDAAVLQSKFEPIFQSAISAARQARDINPADPTNWTQLGNVYANYLLAVNGADTFAIDNYKKAAEADPKNPTPVLVVGQTYMAAADILQARAQRLSGQKGSEEEAKKLGDKRKEYLDGALEYTNKAIELKKDYASAHFLAAQVYDRQGNRARAIEKTIETKNLSPQDIGVRYQLGLLYYFDNQLDAARGEFASAVTLNPKYSNARYFLGLINDKLGDRPGAIAQFEEVVKLNPDNQEVKKVLENLRAGLSALEGIAPAPTQRTEVPLSEGGEQAGPPTAATEGGGQLGQ